MIIKFETNRIFTQDDVPGMVLKELFPNSKMYYIEDTTTEQRRALFNHPDIIDFIVDRENGEPV